ncbi:hypothetical protein [Rhodoblastus sphagnicola]|uniref:hypothetical protein n=1 Tax=Rhodoblastus sphagnicola TaxID=333368 RepID=UPI0011B0A1A1|nr:hypothetical protein [Rhodoblastus sphagnicola]
MITGFMGAMVGEAMAQDEPPKPPSGFKPPPGCEPPPGFKPGDPPPPGFKPDPRCMPPGAKPSQ